jgi:hypothetical protein
MALRPVDLPEADLSEIMAGGFGKIIYKPRYSN